MLTYGEYGGRFVPETLIPALDELEAGWRAAREDPAFQAELDELGRSYAGRPTPLTLAERFAPGKRLYLKREDLLHTGAHKLNNALGQALLALRLGKRRIVAETGAGQHGVATATVCARFGLDCVVYMGSEDMRRQAAEPRADGAARRRGAAGRVRHAHAEGGDERGDPRLDRERRGHALPDRLLRRPGAVPGDRARAAVGDRPRGAGAAARGRGPAAGGRARVRRRRLERDRALRRVPGRRRGAAGRRRGRRRGEPRLGPAGGAARLALVGARRRGRPGARRRSRSRPGSTTRASARSTRSCATAAAPSTSARATRRRWPPSAGSRGPRGSSPRSSPPTRWRASTSSTRSSCWSASPAAATRIWPRSPPGDRAARLGPGARCLLLRRLRRDEWTRFDDGRTPAPSLDVHLDRLRRFVNAGDRVLEVGAGPGRFTIELARLGAQVSRRRLSPGQLELNREHVAAEGLEEHVTERAVADVLDLSRWDDGSFDATSASAARSATSSTAPTRGSPSSSA